MREVDPRGVTDDVGRPCRQQLAVRGDATPIDAESGRMPESSSRSFAARHQAIQRLARVSLWRVRSGAEVERTHLASERLIALALSAAGGRRVRHLDAGRQAEVTARLSGGRIEPRDDEIPS